jgi:hypothetical protein
MGKLLFLPVRLREVFPDQLLHQVAPEGQLSVSVCCKGRAVIQVIKNETVYNTHIYYK